METRMGRVQWGGPGVGSGTRARTSDANWKKPIAWNRKAGETGRRPFVFCSSLADVFDNEVPPDWRSDLFELIAATPSLVWLLLTKRPQNIVKMAEESSPNGWPTNAAIGTTVEDRKRLSNLSFLAKAAARLRPAFTFCSLEPLLEMVDLTDVPWGDGIHGLNALTGEAYLIEGQGSHWPLPAPLPALGWAITGGETDQGEHKARPTHPDAFRMIRDRCHDHGVPFHHKQNGEWVSVSEVAGPGAHFTFPDGATVRRIGKRHSGRTIDGVEHNAFPEICR